MNSVRSIRPSARSARERTLPAPAAASLRRMTDGTTAPVSIEALSSHEFRPLPEDRRCIDRVADQWREQRPSAGLLDRIEFAVLQILVITCAKAIPLSSGNWIVCRAR